MFDISRQNGYIDLLRGRFCSVRSGATQVNRQKAGSVLPLVFGTAGARARKGGGLCVGKAKRIAT
eukprot:1194439-Prorocentrum_minimum.AAC.6